MLPDHLNGSFRRYKKDTDYFVTWLAVTAGSSGFHLQENSDTSDSPQPAARQGPRLKGKARKEAREREKSVTHRSSQNLTTHQLMECAKHIASTKPSPFHVPRSVYDALSNALVARVECSTWFKLQEKCSGNADLQRSNDTHSHFNETLETVRKLLQPFVQRSAKSQRATKSVLAAAPGSKNTFGVLERTGISDKDEDDQEEIPLAPKPAPKPASDSKNLPGETLYQLDSKGDTLVAIHCLLEDFFELRLTVRHNWKIFMDTKGALADLMSTAAMTQCANEVACTLARDFTEKFPDIKSMGEILMLLVEPEVEVGLHIPTEPTTRPEDEHTISTADTSAPQQTEYHKLAAEILQHTYLKTFQFTEDSSALEGIQNCPRINLAEASDEFKEYKRRGDEAMTPLDRLEGCLRTLKSIHSKADVSRQKLLPDADSFTRMWYDALTPASGAIKPGVEQVMVTQMFLDVLTATHLQDGGSWLNSRIDEVFEVIFDTDMALLDLHKEPRPKDATADTLTLSAWPHIPGKGAANLGDATDFLNVYLGLNPVWAGLRLLYRFIGVKLQETDQLLVQGPISSAAHLQNALLQLRHSNDPTKAILEKGWEMLDIAMGHFGKKKIFCASDVPKTVKDCSARARLAMGAKAHDFARNRRRLDRDTRPLKPRSIDLSIPMLRAIMYNYQHQQTMGGSMINAYESRIIQAMDRTLSTIEHIQVDFRRSNPENYLGIFRMLLSLDLANCMFNYAKSARLCSQMLQEALNVLHGERSNRHPCLLPADLLEAEKAALHAARKDIDTGLVVSKHMEHIAEVFVQYKDRYGGFKEELEGRCR
ncbi:uncharacterized protein J4E79_002850 [Alternaria viburni]|uniref:uncharacterized protein n=1 Tax=Alternaria viburni TaxID=566460 RepID=UPI0020C3D80A|nr:uncharacterized protein J4E79_002850 [Alternaria viburni]KAI4666810.1 hypothetical protein J4E79_002850 [Alternaria viburni]